MANDAVRAELDVLSQRLEARAISIEELGPAFERLTYRLVDLSTDDDQALREMVNEIEIIRFARLPNSQLPAAAQVLQRAKKIFDHVP